MRVFVDVDGTLITEYDEPIPHIVELVQQLSRTAGNTVVVWSGGGLEYARRWGERLHFPRQVAYWSKFPPTELYAEEMALFIDDEELVIHPQHLQLRVV